MALRGSGRAADRRAAALGLSDGPPRLMFAWIVAMTHGAALTAPEIERVPALLGYLPDAALDLMFDALAAGDLSQAGEA